MITAYRRSLTNDSTFLAAQSSLAGAREALPQARAGLLPQVSVSVQRTRNYTENTTTQFGIPITRDYRYFAETGVLSLRQPLYRKYNWEQLSYAESQVAAAEAAFQKERQDSILRVAEAYFNVLLAAAQLRSFRAQLETAVEQRKLAERAFAAGYGTRTDVDDARAQAEQAQANILEAENSLAYARHLLSSLVGQVPDAIADVDSERLPLETNLDMDLDSLFVQVEASNPELAALRYQAEMARRDLEKQRAGHFPTVDLIAARQYGANETNATINSNYTTSYIGLQATVPIFTGGGVSAAVRQAQAYLDRALFQLEATRKRLRTETQKYFNAVRQGGQKIAAMQSAVHAAEQSFLSNQKGFQAGSRTILDVLSASQRLAESQRALAQTRYEYLLSYLRLAANLGQLDDQTLTIVNAALRNE